MLTIVETLGDFGTSVKNPDTLAEYVREKLSRAIVRPYLDSQGTLSVLTLAPNAERMVQEGIRHADNGVTFLSMNPAVAQRLVNNISTAADNAVNTDAQPVLLVTPLIRPHLAQIVTRFLPTVPVISQAEIEQINANNSPYAGSTNVAADLGYMPAPVREYSEDGATPVHLDGLQALGYARIRKLDSDFMRTSRQRRVVQAALTALRGRLYDPGMYVRLANVLFGTVETNMNAVEIASLGMKALVCGEIEQMRLPVDGTYDDNGSSIAIDASANAQALREFIYD